MEHTITVQSKVLIQPSLGRRIFIKALWVAVFFVVACAVLGFFLEDFNFRILMKGVLPGVILSRFLSLEGSRPHFRNTLVDLTFGPDTLTIHYQYQGKRKIEDVLVPYRLLDAVEYNEQAQFYQLRFIAPVPGAVGGNFHLLYVDDASSPAFISALTKATGLAITYANAN